MKPFIERYRYPAILLRELVRTDFKIRYKGSVLGYVWTVLKPLALFAIMYVIFIHFLKFGADEPHFAVALLLGIVLWNYFTEVTMNGMSAIVGKGDLMRKLSFPRYVIVIAGSFSALINLAINLVIVGVLIAVNGVELAPRAVLIIPVAIELFVLSLSVAFFLAALYVKLRDANYIWELLLQVGFYATPILYPISLIAKYSQDAAKVALLNPLAQIIQDARYALIAPSTTTTWQAFGGGAYAYIPPTIVVLLLILAVTYFKRQSPSFAENV
ncbi:ABC transporter permease [Candidatus Saccharibacteria bacterium]|nr:MAG: ABC transporter permease [Candidatus Saccharibacteria bacterium]